MSRNHLRRLALSGGDILCNLQQLFEQIEQKCLKCGLMVELDNLRSHVQECTGSEEDSLRNEAQGNVIPSEEELPTYLPLYK